MSLSRWNPWAGLGALPSKIWIHFTATLINRMGTMAVPFLVLYLTKDVGFTAEHAGLMLSLYGAGSLVASPFVGKLADRIGPVRVMKASLLASAAFMFAYPFARSTASVIAVTVLMAMATEAFRPASLSVLTDIAPPELRKAAFAVNRLAINLGMSVGPAVGGYLAEISFPSIFRVNGAASVAAFCVLAFTGFQVAHHAASANPETSAAPRSGPAYKDLALLAFLVASVPLAAVFFQHEGALPLDVVNGLGLSESFFGWMFTINTIMIVLLEVRLNLSTSHWPHRRSLSIGGLFIAVGFGAMAFAHTGAAIAATVVVWTIGEMILLPSMSNYVADLSPADRRGEYMGLYSMSWGVAFALGPWLGTVVLERYGRNVLWGLAFAAAAAAALAMSRMPATREERSMTRASGIDPDQASA
jgi:predicted MFS family arabinose efflux permease